MGSGTLDGEEIDQPAVTDPKFDQPVITNSGCDETFMTHPLTHSLSAHSTHPSPSSRFLAIIVISSGSLSLPPSLRIPHGVGVRVLIPSSELSRGGEAKGTLAFVCFPLSLSLSLSSPGRISNGGSLDYFPKFIPPGLGCSSSSNRLSLSLSLNFSPRMGRNSLKLCLPSLARPPRLIPRPRRTID